LFSQQTLIKLPGLKSNQQDPKVTSHSSYKTSQSKYNGNKDLSKDQNQGDPKKVLSKPDDGPNEYFSQPDDLSEIGAVCPELPEHIKAGIIGPDEDLPEVFS
jgi:hypothetical protein